MIRDRLTRLVGRLRRGRAPSASATGIGAGFSSADPTALQAFAEASDRAFARLVAVQAPLGEGGAPLATALASGARLVRTAARKGAEAGVASGQLGHATAPLGAALRELADRLDAAIPAAVEAGAPAALAEVAGTARDAAGRFGGAMARLPARPDLQEGLLAALATWEGMVLPTLERAVRGDAGPDET